jgi:hypothetical protein
VIVGAAVVPSAPLLVDGVCATPPEEVVAVQDAIDAALEGLPDYDTAVLLSAAEDHSKQGQGLYDATEASLAGVGRPDITRPTPVHRDAVERISRTSQYPMYRGGTLPLGLSVLALLLGGGDPLVPVAVPAQASYESLVGVGTSIAEALSEDGPRAVAIASGDLSAGLHERSPLYTIDGARAWDDQAVDVVESGRLESLDRLGPGEAHRVGARGWAPMVVLHGVCARAKIGLVRRHYSAPRGVGYLVAHGA